MGNRRVDERDDDSAPPMTPELLETCLDRLAKAIDRDRKRGPSYLPIYIRVKAELEKMRRQAATLEEIRDRVRRSLDRNRKPSH